MNESNQLKNIINNILLGLAFLMPVFFVPITTEFFEFNKLMLLTLGTVVMLGLWGITTFTQRKIQIAKGPHDATFLTFVGVVGLASLFATNKVVSLFGSYGRWFPSLFGIGAIFAFYYVLASNIKSKNTIKNALFAFTAGISVNSVISVLSYYGIFIGSQPYFQNRNFTLTGSITTTAILACIAALILANIYIQEKKVPLRVALGIGTVVNLFVVLLANITPIWILLGIGVLVTAALTSPQTIKAEKMPLLALKGAIILMFALAIFPATKKLIIKDSFVKESVLPSRVSWVIASSTIRDFPLLGTGPSTFYLNYPRYKPTAMNNTDFWSLRFDKPYNEVFNVIGTLGILGTVVAIYMGVQITRIAMQNKKLNDLAPVLTVGVLMAVGATLVTYSTVLNTFALLFLFGLCVANKSLSLKEGGNNSGYATIVTGSSANTIGSIDSDNSIVRVLTVTPLVGLIVAGVFYMYRAYPSEYYMRQATLAAMANDGSATYQYQARAINHHPKVDVYHNAYAQTSVALASNLALKGEELTDSERETIRTLLSEAVRNTKISTEVLNPLNPTGWEIKANIYKSLMGGTENADQWAVESFNTAIQLDPTNPRLRLDLGGIYYATEDYLSAANLFRQSANLKPDYANAYYNFGQALIALEDYGNALQALQTVRALIPIDSPDYAQLEKEIEALAARPELAGSEPKPTVEEITGVDAETGATPQEALINKGEETIEESTQSEVIVE